MAETINKTVNEVNSFIHDFYNNEEQSQRIKAIGINGRTLTPDNTESFNDFKEQLPDKARMSMLANRLGARAQFNGYYNRRPVYTEVDINVDLPEPQKSQALSVIQKSITKPEFDFHDYQTGEDGKVWGTKPAVIKDNKKMFVYNRSIGPKSISEETDFNNEGYLEAQIQKINNDLIEAGIDYEVTFKPNEEGIEINNANPVYSEEADLDEQADNQNVDNVDQQAIDINQAAEDVNEILAQYMDNSLVYADDNIPQNQRLQFDRAANHITDEELTTRSGQIKAQVLGSINNDIAEYLNYAKGNHHDVFAYDENFEGYFSMVDKDQEITDKYGDLDELPSIVDERVFANKPLNLTVLEYQCLPEPLQDQYQMTLSDQQTDLLFDRISEYNNTHNVSCEARADNIMQYIVNNYEDQKAYQQQMDELKNDPEYQKKEQIREVNNEIQKYFYPFQDEHQDLMGLEQDEPRFYNNNLALNDRVPQLHDLNVMELYSLPNELKNQYMDLMDDPNEITDRIDMDYDLLDKINQRCSSNKARMFSYLDKLPEDYKPMTEETMKQHREALRSQEYADFKAMEFDPEAMANHRASIASLHPNPTQFEADFQSVYGFVAPGITNLQKNSDGDSLSVELANKTTINDRKNNLSVNNQKQISDGDIKTMVAMAKAKGLSNVKVEGKDAFVKKAWEALENEGITISVDNDRKSKLLYKQYLRMRKKNERKNKTSIRIEGKPDHLRRNENEERTTQLTGEKMAQFEDEAKHISDSPEVRKKVEKIAKPFKSTSEEYLDTLEQVDNQFFQRNKKEIVGYINKQLKETGYKNKRLKSKDVTSLDDCFQQLKDSGLYSKSWQEHKNIEANIKSGLIKDMNLNNSISLTDQTKGTVLDQMRKKYKDQMPEFKDEEMPFVGLVLNKYLSEMPNLVHKDFKFSEDDTNIEDDRKKLDEMIDRMIAHDYHAMTVGEVKSPDDVDKQLKSEPAVSVLENARDLVLDQSKAYDFDEFDQNYETGEEYLLRKQEQMVNQAKKSEQDVAEKKAKKQEHQPKKNIADKIRKKKNESKDKDKDKDKDKGFSI